jgi:hypothetical protein
MWLTLCAGQAVLAQSPPGFYRGLTNQSTPEGDAVRLNAYSNFLTAWAGANLNRAHADVVDQSMMIAWNEYYHGVLNEQYRRTVEHREARRKRLLENYRKRQQRIAEDPTELDLMNGDALNKLLAQLSDPKILPSQLKEFPVSIPGDIIQHIAFHHGPADLTISIGRLTVRDGWPLAIRDKAFSGERGRYEQAIEKALEQNRDGKLTPQTYDELQNAVAALRARAQGAIASNRLDNQVQARVFLEDLSDAVRSLHHPNAEKVLAGIDRYAGTTAGDAVVFMQRFNLRFAPALRAEEREAYHLLYASMMQLRDGLSAFDDGSRPKKPGQD